MLHRTCMTAKCFCFITAAVLAAGLLCALFACDGIGMSIKEAAATSALRWLTPPRPRRLYRRNRLYRQALSAFPQEPS